MLRNQKITLRRGGNTATSNHSLPLTNHDISSPRNKNRRRRTIDIKFTSIISWILIASFAIILVTMIFTTTMSLFGITINLPNLIHMQHLHRHLHPHFHHHKLHLFSGHSAQTDGDGHHFDLQFSNHARNSNSDSQNNVPSAMNSHNPQNVRNSNQEKQTQRVLADRINQKEIRSSSALPLDKFPVVARALRTSELVALYFAASWCPMSTPVTLAMDDSFGPFIQDLATQNENNQNLEKSIGDSTKKPLTIIYISSDKTPEEYNSYTQPRPYWTSIPFFSPEIIALKKHFATCAKRELEELNIDRKNEIPTIIVLDGEMSDGGILTMGAASDVISMGGMGALEHWRELLEGVRDTKTALEMDGMAVT